jgi:hypothetical protein
MRSKPALLMKPDYPGYSMGRGNIRARAFVRLSSRWRAYAAAIVAALAMLVLGAVLVREVDRSPTPVRPSQTSPNPAFPTGYAPSPAPPASLGLLFGKASLEQQTAAAKSAVNRMIEGKLDRQTHEMFKQFPEYGRCQSCIEECEQGLKGAAEIQLQECRRNCLRTCSDKARQLIDGGL